jgi:FkbM family methyltransferase
VKLRLAYRAWKARFRDQRLEVALTRALVRPGDLAVDAGANKGAYVYWLQRAVGPAGRVMAFEPQPRLASYLRRACDAFGWSNVRISDVALSDHVGKSVLHVPGADVSPGASLEPGVLAQVAGRSFECSVDTLDRQLEGQAGGPLRFLKVDVEGHELALFRGAEGALRRDKPHLLFECETRHLTMHSTTDVFSYLEALGYKGFLLLERALLPVDQFDPDRHQRRGGPDFWKRDDYYNNFLFVATGFDLKPIIERI